MPGSYFPEETGKNWNWNGNWKGAADQDDNQTPPYKRSLVELFRAEAVAVSLDTLNKEPIQFTHSSAWVLEATRTTTERKLKELETSKCIWQNAHTLNANGGWCTSGCSSHSARTAALPSLAPLQSLLCCVPEVIQPTSSEEDYTGFVEEYLNMPKPLIPKHSMTSATLYFHIYYL